MTDISKEYAEALFSLASENGQLSAAGDALGLVEDQFSRNPAFQALLRSPAIPVKERIRALDTAFEKQVPVFVLALLRMLCTRGQIALTGKISACFRQLCREAAGITVANVTSAVELTQTEREKLCAALGKRLGRQVELHCTVDPALIGGIRVEADGRVLDGSVREKLQQIRDVMNA